MLILNQTGKAVMKNIVALGVFGLMTCSLIAADAVTDEVKAAAKKLADNSYSWKITVQVPEGTGGQFRPGPTEGKIAKDGTVYLVMTRGENTIEAAVKGEKGALKTEEGWKSVAELSAGGDQPNRGTFMARMLTNYKSPAAQAETLAASVKDLKKAEGVYSGDLTEEGAKQMLSFGRRPGGQTPEPKGAKGSVKFWVKDGQLVKYEFNVQGTISGRDNQEFEVNRTTTTEIKDIGSTKVELPEGAKAKL
jgi:hypothetical protein